MNVLLLARMPPDPAQPFVTCHRGTHHDRRRVMEKSTERLVAEFVILPRVKDEFVPKLIHDLGRHGDHFAAGIQISEKELPQAARDERTVLEVESRLCWRSFS